MDKIYAASKYSHTNDLWIISCFYNSNSYKSKPLNFNMFLEKIEAANLNYLIVECAFKTQPFSLKKSKNILRIRTPDIMWQKERLLNIALDNLPTRCKKIAWVDCDILFENPDWAIETAEKLKYYKIVQPFKEAVRLPKETIQYEGIGERYESFGYVCSQNPYIVSEGRFDLHGHTGFAWAANKSVFSKLGFYDVCIAGSGDHMMAHSFVGDWTTKCIKRVIGNNPHFYNHYLEWSRKIYTKTKAKISYVDGTLLHLWHGDVENRNYVIRQRTLEQFGFDPANDIKLNKNKCWEWNHGNEKLINWAEEYFVLRKED
jgi:hypothetical protein